MLPEAIGTVRAWGFQFKSAGAWAKQSSTGEKLALGTGYCYRSAAEFWLLATLGKPRQKVRNIRNYPLRPSGSIRVSEQMCRYSFTLGRPVCRAFQQHQRARLA